MIIIIARQTVIPSASKSPCKLPSPVTPTITPTPTTAATLAAIASFVGRSRRISQASTAVTSGTVAYTIETWATEVWVSAVINNTMPTAETIAKIQPDLPSDKNSITDFFRSRLKLISAKATAPKTPRHSSNVQLSSGIMRVNNPALLQASVAAVTSNIPVK